MFLGAVADFGWMYMNLSRLQNAADAAVTAGAKNLISDEQNLSDYSYSTFVANSEQGLQRLIDESIISTRDTSDGDKVAKEYVIKNMSSDGELTDGWNKNKPVNFQSILYGVDEENYKSLYYMITLSEEVPHLFSVMDYFKFAPMKIKAVAVAHISHNVHGLTLYNQMNLLRNNENYATWDHIKKEYEKMKPEDFAYLGVGDNTTNAARARSVQAKGNEHVEGNYYRTETLTLHGWSIATTGKGSTTGNKMDQRNLDNLFVDFKVDINGQNFSKDMDLGTDTLLSSQIDVSSSDYNLDVNNKRIENNQWYYNNTIEGKTILNYRIHDLINIGKWNGSSYTYEYHVRPGKEPPDPLYVYIESENIYSHQYQSTTSFNTVRQIIININAANTDENKDRPIFFFYDGPEKIEGKSTKTWHEDWRESWKYPSRYADNPRNSLPVILNLNADFRGVLYMPNSPVVVNGNGYNFEGFVVAQEFLHLKNAEKDLESYTYVEENDETSDEETDELYAKYYNDKLEDFPATKTIDGVTCEKKIDSTGNVVYGIKHTDADGKERFEIKYTYTKITQEKSNLLKTFANYEKEYIDLYPMFIDEWGNVQYIEDPIEPTQENDESTHADDTSIFNDDKFFTKDDFNLGTSEFNGFEKVSFKNYTYLQQGVVDNFFESKRANWID